MKREHLKVLHHPEEYKKATAVKVDTIEKRKKNDEERVEQARIYCVTQPSSSSQLTFDDLMNRGIKWSKENQQQKKIEQNLMNWVCDSLQPYSVVENEQFKVLVESLQPKFSVPSEKVIRQTMIPRLYRQVQYDLKQELLKLLEVTDSSSLPYCTYNNRYNMVQ